MDKNEQVKLLNIIKEHVQMFLLDGGEFYPFGIAIGIDGQIKSIGVYVEDEHPSSLELIDLLQKGIKKRLDDDFTCGRCYHRTTHFCNYRLIL